MLALGLCALVVPGCRNANEAGARRPNVLLVTIDTLSFREVGFLGGGEATPNLDRFASESVVFRNAYSTSSWTQPAIASMFTGLYPTRHGIDQVFEALPEEAGTLAESLSEAGYRTAGVVSNFLLRREFGLAQGFAGWEQEPSRLVGGRSSPEVTDRAIHRLRNAPRDAPWFLYVHYMDPHFPYLPHTEFDRSSGYEGALAPTTSRKDLKRLLPELEAADYEYLRNLYREEVAFTDHHLGRLLEALDGSGAAEDTLVIITSDHGEEFFEHGWFEHIRTLYDELVRMVLVVRWPGTPAAVVEDPVSVVSVPATVLEAAGVRPEFRFDGRPLPRGPRPRSSDPTVPIAPDRPGRAFLEVDFVPTPHMGDAFDPILNVSKTGLVVDGLKLVRDLKVGRYELFDLARDPFETDNLYPGHAAASDLVAELSAWEAWKDASAGASQEVELDQQGLDALRKLGYVE